MRRASEKNKSFLFCFFFPLALLRYFLKTRTTAHPQYDEGIWELV